MKRDDSKRRIWIVTDVPFWRKSNGSHLRIIDLARSLVESDFQVTLWQIGSPDVDALDELLTPHSWDSVTGPDFPPLAMKDRVVWHAQGTANVVREWVANRMASQLLDVDSNADSGQQGMQLSEFEVEPICKRLVDDVRAHSPDIVLFEYISLSYLAKVLRHQLDPCPQLVLDTHDVMHLRAEEFKRRGIVHWLEIDKREESAALDLFDLIVAIQPTEHQVFESMVTRAKVVTAGYSIDALDGAPMETSVPDNRQSSICRIGFIGGKGEANRIGILDFIENCWHTLTNRTESQLELHIAGYVCEQLAEEHLPDQVFLNGPQTDVSHWYREIDVAINPSNAGAGLKIKNIEALANGTCLVTTRVGIQGLEGAVGEGAFVAESVAEMGNPIRSLADSLALRKAASKRAISYIQSKHQRRIVFEELLLALKH